TTVLAPGANVYHYNHIHVDLMRHYNGRHVCEPGAIPGEVAAARARSQLAQHDRGRYGDPGVTGSIATDARERHSGEDDDSLPEALPGED
ncbi:MAG TPA: extensin family protein, partial [Xanthobacteraceae bacterium]|nr:extensin family protein [Xanthobacteraceae bacterium]